MIVQICSIVFVVWSLVEGLRLATCSELLRSAPSWSSTTVSAAVSASKAARLSLRSAGRALSALRRIKDALGGQGFSLG